MWNTFVFIIVVLVLLSLVFKKPGEVSRKEEVHFTLFVNLILLALLAGFIIVWGIVFW
jgi:hypothetical protein